MIDYDQLYKDTVSIVKSATNGVYTGANVAIDIKRLVDKTYEALKSLAERVDKEHSDSLQSQSVPDDVDF